MVRWGSESSHIKKGRAYMLANEFHKSRERPAKFCRKMNAGPWKKHENDPLEAFT